jgi:MerR family transcriptional regulator, heat shock protein HspR
VIKYYLQIYHSDWDPLAQQDRVRIDELPFQQSLLERLSVLGIISIEDRMLPADQIERVSRILRMHKSLGVNLSGAAIICELMDRMEQMEEEIERQRLK